MNKLVFAVLLISSSVFAQDTYTIQGQFPNFPKSSFELKGYEGFQENVLIKTSSDTAGRFTLTYPADYVGFAQLDMNGAYATLLFLNKENVSLYWEDLTNRDDLQVSGSREYDAFIQGMKTFQEAEAKLAGWNYLLPLYEKDSLKQLQMASELDTVNNLFPNYVKSLPEDLWVRQYLLTKGLIEQMPNSVKTYTWRAPQHVGEFMAIDFKVMNNSGLLKQAIEGYTYLVERFPLEEVTPLLNAAIDKVIAELKDEPTTQQEVAQHWFTFLERHSLFSSAEYLALKMLNDESCMLDEKSTNLFEQYRKMANGKVAPNILLDAEDPSLNNLKSIDARYKLEVFGASWCPTCKADYPKLKEKYASLKANKDLEIVYVSLDTDMDAYEAYYGEAPFITYCDGKGWESQAAADYHIFATPSYYLLDKELKILIKIKTVEHLESWLANR